MKRTRSMRDNQWKNILARRLRCPIIKKFTKSSKDHLRRMQKPIMELSTTRVKRSFYREEYKGK